MGYFGFGQEVRFDLLLNEQGFGIVKDLTCRKSALRKLQNVLWRTSSSKMGNEYLSAREKPLLSLNRLSGRSTL